MLPDDRLGLNALVAFVEYLGSLCMDSVHARDSPDSIRFRFPACL